MNILSHAFDSRYAKASYFATCLLGMAFSVLLLDGCSHSYGFGSNSSDATTAVESIAISPVLPAATVGSAYAALVEVVGGTPPYSFSLSAGDLPANLTLNGEDGDISGLPTIIGSFAFTVSVSDSKGHSKQQALQIAVTPNPDVSIVVSPSKITLTSGASTKFDAMVTNTSYASVKWSASQGNISSSGLYTAPSVSVATSATVYATTAADPTKSATATITITPPPPSLAVALTPLSVTISSGSTSQFIAQVANSSNSAVNWTASQGSISSSGLYTAPVVSASTLASVRATSVADPTKSASATVTITAPPLIVGITVTPSSITMSSGATSQFTAQVTNSSNTAVDWAASQGSISSSGLYTAPSVSATTSASVTATSVEDPSKSASAIVTITLPPPAVSITLTPLSVTVSSGSTSQFTVQVVNSSNTAVNWVASQGSISNSGLYTAPQVTATTSATITATSVEDPTKSASATVTITAPWDADDLYCAPGDTPVGAVMDGPALLPENCINTSLANTPSPGAVIAVTAGADLQAAYNSLLCGQTLLLPHGGTWKGPLRFTPKGCDDQHWITISSDGVLPPPGTRVAPIDLPQLAAISMKGDADSITITGDHLRLVGIAFLKQQGGNRLVDMVTVPRAVNVIFDRIYAHGNPGEETRRFLNESGGNYIAVVESYVDEMHCVAGASACTDAQAISGGHGSIPNGTYKIVNNFLSAGTENILFGGSAATVTPCDIEIRNNYFYKPLSWNPSDPSYAGTKYVVKNLFELKNACRVFLEGNVFANNWGGFTQRGLAILIGPKNQDQNGANVCPLCFISDVVMRYNWITTAAGIFAIDTGVTKSGGWAASGHSYSIHDIIAENLQYSTCYGCGHNLSEFAAGYSTTNPPPQSDVLHDVAINHLTIVSAVGWPPAILDETAMMEMGGPPADNPTNTPQMSNITYENSISSAGTNGFYATGGGSDNCVVGEKTLADIISACWAGSSLFGGNLIVAYSGDKAPWPSGNMLAPSWDAVDFLDYNGGDGGDYILADDSPFKGKALDGTDPGANVDLVQQYTQDSISGVPISTSSAGDQHVR